MTRADQGGGAIRRARRSGLALLGVLLVSLVVAGPASAESPSAAPGPLPPVPAFHLRASDGYKLSVLAATDRKTGMSRVLVIVGNRNSTVLYSTNAVVTDTSIEADLGAVGRIDVDFVPSGKPRTEGPACGGKPVTFAGGRWEGVIDFEGENGYSEAHAESVRDEAKPFLDILCGATAWSIGSGPGALLTAKRRGRTSVEFEAMKNGPARRARFSASITEKRGSLAINRSVVVVARPSAFEFDIPAGTATVDPPAPFSGRAEYLRGRGGSSIWRGGLYVDFPGRPNVALTGAGRHTSLERAFMSPARTFGSS